MEGNSVTITGLRSVTLSGMSFVTFSLFRRGIDSNLSDPDTSFIAARYLPQTFLLKKAVGVVFDRLLNLFVHYIYTASRNRKDVEWSNLSKCVKDFTSAFNHHPFLFFGNHFLTPGCGPSNTFATNMIQ